ncbi:PLD nuclease N-terminal domain-containing protein [Petrocella sp. FN5]|uniref:PLD nuclease N-terminal domain-containing protein n=1 Tax=Petrocella sp. FN5 TaxID=3032002 RepID=UPI0023DB5D50|nr:PLD nuclease N-terminal domain-containing protein [Petrocella sp. FN5]MDF1618615.1 PLD nuclease N-terminal domain-containing protein [Petrocella sp. FN5]
MNTIELTGEMIIMLLPLLAIQMGLTIYCVIKIMKEGVENLNKWAWLAICIFINLIGPITFLIVGRKRDAS